MLPLRLLPTAEDKILSAPMNLQSASICALRNGYDTLRNSQRARVGARPAFFVFCPHLFTLRG